MKLIQFNGNTLEMFDSIQELVVSRYQKYNSNVMIDAGIGGDLNSFRDRANNVKRLMRVDIEKAELEMDNMVNCVTMIMSDTSPEMNSFVVLIHKINGRVITDEQLSDSGIEEIKKKLAKLPVSKIRAFLNFFKKKVEVEFETFFPEIGKGSNKELYLMLKKKIGLKLREVIIGVDLSEDLKKIEDFFTKKMKPKVYGGSGGLEVKMINGFEDMCTVLIKNNLAIHPKKLTVVEFYNKLIFLEKMIKENNKRK